jgi:taurine--2-oxoglutarate transaminase
MCCAAALANLEVIEDENLVENAYVKGLLIEEKLAELIAKHPSMKEQRGLGLARGFLVHESLRGRPELTKIFNKFAELGYPTNGNNGLIIIAPPLIVTDEEIEAIMSVVDTVMASMDKLVKE